MVTIHFKELFWDSTQIPLIYDGLFVYDANNIKNFLIILNINSYRMYYTSICMLFTIKEGEDDYEKNTHFQLIICTNAYALSCM